MEVGGRAKSISNGGGNCGFLNCVLALAFVEYLEESGAYSPGLLIVDSPVTMLSESEYTEKQDTMKSGLLRYLRDIYSRGDTGNLQTQQDGDAMTSAEQIIIIEQTEKLPMLDIIMKDAAHVNIIQFTKNREHGRYGFLNDVYEQD